jgi:hypothetical protein
MAIWPKASSAQNSMASVSAQGSTVWVLNPTFELLVQSLDLAAVAVSADPSDAVGFCKACFDGVGRYDFAVYAATATRPPGLVRQARLKPLVVRKPNSS